MAVKGLTINSPNTLHTLCLGQVGRIEVKILGDKGVNQQIGIVIISKLHVDLSLGLFPCSFWKKMSIHCHEFTWKPNRNKWKTTINPLHVTLRPCWRTITKDSSLASIVSSTNMAATSLLFDSRGIDCKSRINGLDYKTWLKTYTLLMEAKMVAQSFRMQ